MGEDRSRDAVQDGEGKQNLSSDETLAWAMEWMEARLQIIFWQQPAQSPLASTASTLYPLGKAVRRTP